jgi:hypothetical protein
MRAGSEIPPEAAIFAVMAAWVILVGNKTRAECDSMLLSNCEEETDLRAADRRNGWRGKRHHLDLWPGPGLLKLSRRRGSNAIQGPLSVSVRRKGILDQQSGRRTGLTMDVWKESGKVFTQLDQEDWQDGMWLTDRTRADTKSVASLPWQGLTVPRVGTWASLLHQVDTWAICRSRQVPQYRAMGSTWWSDSSIEYLVWRRPLSLIRYPETPQVLRSAKTASSHMWRGNGKAASTDLLRHVIECVS